MSDERLREIVRTIQEWNRVCFGDLSYCPDCDEFRNVKRCIHCGLGTWQLEDAKEVAKSRGVRLICETGVMFQ